MSAAVAVVPNSGLKVGDVVRVDVTGGSENTLTGYNASNYPASPEVVYYLTFELGGAVLGKSYRFAVASDGTHSFPNFMLPETGSWTVRLSNAADDSSVATASITVS